MREISEEYKMTARCPWEVRDMLREAEAWTARDKSTWQVHREDGGTKAPTNAAILSAVLLWFRSLSHDQQVAAMRAGMAEVNALIRAENSAPQITPPQTAPRPGSTSKRTRQA